MERIAAFIVGVQAKRGFVGFLISALLGALGVLGHAPFHIWPAFAVSICGLFILMDAAAGRPKPLWAGFAVTWSWAFGYFLAGLFWVGNAFLVDADKFALLMPFAVTALPAGLAVFTGLGGLIAAKFWRTDAMRLCVFALAISLSEFARGHLLTGLPWNLPAYIWRPGGAISQTGALIGPYGLTLITCFVLAAPMVWLTGKSRAFQKRTSLVAAAFVLSMGAYGLTRLSQAGQIDPMKGNGPIVSAGQGGFTQREVWDPANSMRVTQTYLDLLDNVDAKNSDIVVWPEGTFPYLLLEQPELLAELKGKLGNRTLALGSIRREASAQGDIYRNSILVFDSRNDKLNLRAAYDKFHLVPFGEYLPFRRIFKALGIASLVSYDGEMSPGPSPSTLAVTDAPLADPRVCYEIVFPAFNQGATGQAKWILNVSIDAWFGDQLGPDQHYAQARARAIETGMPLVRAASGGWSAIVDRYGRPLAEHPHSAGFARARLPLDANSTFYAKYGNWPFLYLSFFILVLMITSRKKS